MIKKFLFICLTVCSISTVHAVILYGAGNNATTSAPSNGAPFGNVVHLGSGGTAVYIGNGYFLTAHHVSGTTISFDGSTHINIDTSFGTNGYISVGTADLKVFRVDSPLVEALPAIKILDEILPNGAEVTLIGGGYGRSSSSPINTDMVVWAGPQAIRWGLNNIYSKVEIEEGSIVYQAYVTMLNDPTGGGLGSYEAGLALADSGSPMFYQIGEEWYLAGIATLVSRSNESYFGNTTIDGDHNYFVNLYYLIDEIYAITGLIPEPAEYAALFGIISLGLAAYGRRKPKTAA